MSGNLQEIMALAVVPILLLIAWRSWAKDDRAELTAWRSGVGLTALLILSLNWGLALLADAPQLLDRHTLPLNIKSVAYFLSFPLDIDAMVLAFALRGAARLEAIFAGMLLLVCWPGGYN
jgi:4-amino-4-deoxy-L-arabinose transferase-like glycosyltransferase